MALRLYNTQTRQKEEFVPLNPDSVTMYNCGPTVYSYPSIGNYRAFLPADLLRRYLEFKGYEVKQVMNITDVGHMVGDVDQGEDKIEKQARKEKRDPLEIARFYESAFFKDIDELSILRATVYPRATEHVSDMIALIERLLENGHAYQVDGSVYYDLDTFPEYGKLSGNTIESLVAGSRVEVLDEKKHPYDFALWIRKAGHLLQWDSPWGSGYPGWHIECSAMSTRYLGETIDIHTGGEDNIFPHHECEIAQSEGASGKQFVRYWLHVRLLLVDGAKMSKSVGNVYTLKDIKDRGFTARALRYLLISNNYRQPMNFTFDALEAATGSVKRLHDFLDHLDRSEPGDATGIGKTIAGKIVEQFEEAMDDDLNISKALAAVFDGIRDAYRQPLSAGDAELLREAMQRIDSVLGVMHRESTELEPELQQMIDERQEARKQRDFKRADELRDELKARGIIIEDSPEGVRWKRVVT